MAGTAIGSARAGPMRTASRSPGGVTTTAPGPRINTPPRMDAASSMPQPGDSRYMHWGSRRDREASMVQLVPMTEAEFKDFLEQDIREYAAEKARAGFWSEKESLHRSRSEHRMLLPDGLKSRYHHLYTVRASEGGEKVGYFWFRAELDSAAPSGFIFDIEIHEQFRGKGYGREAMLEAEKIAREMGLRQLGLSVFAFNE